MQRRGNICVFIATRSTAHDRPCPSASHPTHGSRSGPGCFARQTRSLRLRDILAEDQALRAAFGMAAPRGRKPTKISCAAVDVPDVCAQMGTEKGRAVRITELRSLDIGVEWAYAVKR